MPPRYLRKSSPTRLKPCQERTFEVCETAPTDQCCGVIPCKLCLEWETYEGGISYGSADFATSSWTGTAGGGAFVAYWERNAYDECEFVVMLDGDEVYRATCDEGASCRNPSGEVSATIGYDEGTLRWSVYEPRELQLTEDPDTGCRDFFCGSCRCSCDCLCVTITDAANDVTTGEICDVAYPCDAPVWEGTVGTFELSVALGRDMYGRCIITATVGGIEQEPVLFPGCADGVATVTLEDGTTIALTCKKCVCAEPASCPCCPGWPETASGSISWSSEVVPSDCTDGGGSEPTGDFSCPQIGDEEGTLIRQDATFLRVRLFCDPETLAWKAQYRSATSGGGFEQPISDTWADATDLEFICPDCADAIDGQATGQVDFIAQMACETSGGVVTYDVLVHGEVTIGCP